MKPVAQAFGLSNETRHPECETDKVQYFSHIWEEEGCSPPSLKEGILPMASNNKQKEDYMTKDISKQDEREAGSEVKAGLIQIDMLFQYTLYDVLDSVRDS